MEGMGRQMDGGYFLIGDFHAPGIFVFIQCGAHCEPGCGAGGRDQLNNGFEAA
jgi:hypothetical protein